MDAPSFEDELDDEFLTMAEVAKDLGVRSEKALMLIRWAIGYYRVGGRVLVSGSSLNDFLRSVKRLSS